MAVGQLLLSRKTREPRNTPNIRKDEVTTTTFETSIFRLVFALDQLAPSDGIMERYMNESPC